MQSRLRHSANRFNFNKISLSRYWTPLKPLAGETPSFWVKKDSRNGLVLQDSINPGVNDISILPAHLTTSAALGTTGYAYINDNGALDIGNEDFTICGRIKFLGDKTDYRQCFGKNVAGSVNGRYGVYVNITDGRFSAIIQSSANVYVISSTIDATLCGEAFLLMDVNQTIKKLRFFIWTLALGYNQIGASVDFTGTFANLSNIYRFYLGCSNISGTGTPAYITPNEYSDVRIFNRILTEAEQLTLVNRGSVSNPKAFYPCNNHHLYDSSGNNYHLSTINITSSHITYSTLGSRQSLDAGYTRYMSYPEIQIPYTHTAIPCTFNPGFTKDADIPTDLLNHNGADSYLNPVANTMDRSNSTTCTPSAVLLDYQFRYNVNFKNGLHATEATNSTILKFFKVGYNGKNFIKREGKTITDWVHYTTNKTGVDYDKVIKWSKETIIYNVFGSGSFLSMGMDSVYNGDATHLYLGKAINYSEPFAPIIPISYTGAPTPQIGNPKVLPLNINKCSGKEQSLAGEINWLMTYETTLATPQYLSKSYNGIDWEFILELPGLGLTPAKGLGQCDFFVENDDPSDWHNIHVITFQPDLATIYETHPLNANFTEWSDLVLIFSTGVVETFNCVIRLINGVYHMFYSTATVGQNHFMHHAICTYGALTAVNDWHNIQTGNWSGLGDIESFSLINLGGSSWILFYLQINISDRWTSVYKYSLSTDDCATWSEGVTIPSLSSPLQFSVGVIKLI